MPYGRDFHTLKAFEPPKLETEVLAKMRAPPDGEELETLKSEIEADSDDEASVVPGSFPEGRAQSTSAYY